jgi:hypothetical protein
MRVFFVMTLLAVFVIPTVVFAEVQTFTATHSYILGDHDSKDDARQRCLLETKRKVLEQAGVYIESASEVSDFALTKDKITSFAAGVMQVKDTKEEVGFQQGHMTLTLTLTAQVDMEEVGKRLAARQVDTGVREDVAAQKERLKRLEAQIEAMQKQQQLGQAPGRAPASLPSDISAADLQTLRRHAAQGDALAQFSLGWLYYFGTSVSQDHVQAAKWYEKAAAQGSAGAQFIVGWLYANGDGVPQDYVQAAKWYEKAAAQGFAGAQFSLGWLYANGDGVPQDYVQAAKWYEKAAAQGDARAQVGLGWLYHKGTGVPQDYVQAAKWYEKAAAQGDAHAQVGLGELYHFGHGVPQDYVRAYMWHNFAAARVKDDLQKLAATIRDDIARRMTPAQIAEAQRLASRCQAQQFKGC